MQIFTEITNLASDVGALSQLFRVFAMFRPLHMVVRVLTAKMGLKMEVECSDIFLFWHRIMYFNGLLAHRHIRCVLRDLKRHASSPKTKSIFVPQP